MLTRDHIDYDLYHCPLSLGIMRHPVLASDGHHYELCELLKYFESSERLISPITKQSITSVIYDMNLKSTIDKIFGEDPDREKNYNHKLHLEKILKRVDIENLSLSFNSASIPASLLGLMSGTLPALVALMGEAIKLRVAVEDLHPADALEIAYPYYLFGMATGLLDYTIRRATNNRVGLVKSLINIGYTLFQPHEPLDNTTSPTQVVVLR
jgi:hypothetical protein